MTRSISTAEEYEAAKREAAALEQFGEDTAEAAELEQLKSVMKAWQEAQKTLDQAGSPGLERK